MRTEARSSKNNFIDDGNKISKACKVPTEQVLSKCWEQPWEYTSQLWGAQQGLGDDLESQ